MRLFIAADASDETRAALGELREQLAAALARAPIPPRVTWVNPELAHITVRFIGEMPDADVPRLQGALEGEIDVAPFDVTWGTVGTFPGGRSPRVVWVGATAGADGLRAVAAAVDARLAGVVDRAGPDEPRSFAPHLTVGRLKDAGRGVDWPRLLAAVTLRPSTTRVGQIVLYRSQTFSRGPTYTALCRVILRRS